MKHCIIAKFNDTAGDKAAMTAQIEALLSSAPAMDGIHGHIVLRNCVDRDNRYDLAIVIDMDKAALPVWDASELHREWDFFYFWGLPFSVSAHFCCTFFRLRK